MGGIASLDRRVRVYLNRQQSEETSNEVVKTYLEEVIGRCGTLQEEVLSSIENWTDIVPEANIRSQIGVITDLREQTEELHMELDNLKKESEETQGKPAEETRALEQQIRDKQSELSKARHELAQARSSSLTVPLLGTWAPTRLTYETNPFRDFLSPDLLGPIEALPPSRYCRHCEESFQSWLSTCPKCGREAGP